MVSAPSSSGADDQASHAWSFGSRGFRTNGTSHRSSHSAAGSAGNGDGEGVAMDATGQAGARAADSRPAEIHADVHPLLNLSPVDEQPALASAATAQPVSWAGDDRRGAPPRGAGRCEGREGLGTMVSAPSSSGADDQASHAWSFGSRGFRTNGTSHRSSHSAAGSAGNGDGEGVAMDATGQAGARAADSRPAEIHADVHPLLNLSPVDEQPALASAATAQPVSLSGDHKRSARDDGPFGSFSDRDRKRPTPESLTGDIAAIIQSLQASTAEEAEVWGDADQLNLDGTVHRSSSTAGQVGLLFVGTEIGCHNDLALNAAFPPCRHSGGIKTFSHHRLVGDRGCMKNRWSRALQQRCRECFAGWWRG